MWKLTEVTYDQVKLGLFGFSLIGRVTPKVGEAEEWLHVTSEGDRSGCQCMRHDNETVLATSRGKIEFTLE